jgi:Pectate lyase superfamily protein
MRTVFFIMLFGQMACAVFGGVDGGSGGGSVSAGGGIADSAGGGGQPGTGGGRAGVGGGSAGSIDASADSGFGGGMQTPNGGWRSALYPTTWLPRELDGGIDDAGHFLPDFSFAGFRRGEQKPPYGAVPVVATVNASFGDGVVDATAAIAAAIATACSSDGGAVLLPPGTFKIRFPNSAANAALNINCSNVVLRGSGRTQTFILFDDEAHIRNKAALRIAGAGSILDNDNVATLATPDLPNPTRTISLASTTPFQPGDLVAIRSDVTPSFRSEYKMDTPTNGDTVDWWPTGSHIGFIYLRRLVSVNASQIVVDEPTRLPMKMRDNLRVYSRPQFIQNVGLEDFSIGMKESTAPGLRDADNDYGTPGRMGYLVHGSYAILVDLATDVWVHRVDSFKPPGNVYAHVMSHGFATGRGSARVTVDDSRFGFPQYRGGGGNGYLYHANGQDSLFVDVRAEGGRHDLTLNDSTSTGNVFLRALVVASRYSVDSHRYLTHQNLFDNVTLDASWLQSANRGSTSSGAGHTGTQNTYWKTHVVSLPALAAGCAIETAQAGYGYVIGKSGPGNICLTVMTTSVGAALDQGLPLDWVEGADAGTALFPSSLYLDQRAKRCAREAIACPNNWP